MSGGGTLLLRSAILINTLHSALGGRVVFLGDIFRLSSLLVFKEMGTP